MRRTAAPLLLLIFAACGSSEPDPAQNRDAAVTDSDVTADAGAADSGPADSGDAGLQPDAMERPLAPAWTQSFDPPPVDPAERWGTQAIMIPSEGRFLVFGGARSIGVGATLGDLWSFELATGTWSEVDDQDAPPPRYCHCATYLPDQHQLLLVGGRNLRGPLAPAAWTYDLATRVWQAIDGDLPTGVIGCSVVWMPSHPGGGRAVLFGGQSPTALPQETWIYDPAARTFSLLLTATTPPGRRDAMMAADPAGRVLLWSGALSVFPPENARFLEDFWAYDGNDWVEVSALGTAPAPRRYAASAFDPGRREWIIYSGTKETEQFDELWRFDATTDTWSLLPVTGAARPNPRGFAAFTFDPGSDRYALFGGLTQPDFVDVSAGWTLQLRP